MSAAPRTIRTVLVLGAGSDIALATLRALAGQGLERAVLAARRPDEVRDRVAAQVPGVTLIPLAWDATEVGSHTAMVAEARTALGTIDLVLCAVGLLGHHAGLGMEPADVDDMVRANFAGPASALIAVADALLHQGRGTIVVLSSVAGVRARRSNFVYGSTKAGLDTFAQGLGDALVGTGVRVVVVRPGFVRSKMTEGLPPAPFATEPDRVGAAVVHAVQHPRAEVVPVPPVLGPLFGVLRNLPRSLWRRVAGDR